MDGEGLKIPRHVTGASETSVVKFSLDRVNSEAPPSPPPPPLHRITSDYAINLYQEREAVPVIVLFTSVNPPLRSHTTAGPAGGFLFSFLFFLPVHTSARRLSEQICAAAA